MRPSEHEALWHEPGALVRHDYPRALGPGWFETPGVMYVIHCADCDHRAYQNFVGEDSIFRTDAELEAIVRQTNVMYTGAR